MWAASMMTLPNLACQWQTAYSAVDSEEVYVFSAVLRYLLNIRWLFFLGEGRYDREFHFSLRTCLQNQQWEVERCSLRIRKKWCKTVILSLSQAWHSNFTISHRCSCTVTAGTQDLNAQVSSLFSGKVLLELEPEKNALIDLIDKLLWKLESTHILEEAQEESSKKHWLLFFCDFFFFCNLI